MIAYTNYLTDARVRREAETLASLPGYEISFLVLKKGFVPETYKISGVEIIELNIGKYQGKSQFKYLLSYFFFIFLSFIACNKLFLIRKTKIVHIHNMPDILIFAAVLPRLFGEKIILDIHDSMPETYSTKFSKKTGRFLFKLMCWEEALCCRIANKVICVNHVQRQALINRGIDANKIVISMNVPDPKRFSPIKNMPAVRNTHGAFNLVYHGTITKRLGIDLAIIAVSKLIVKIPEIKFQIYGNGDDIDEFIKLSHSLGINEYIHFNKKMIPVEDLIEKLRNMNVGIISNRKNVATELMLPVKMLEYIMLGIPVIAPRLKTIEYYFNNEMVSYFEPENVDSLTSAVLELYQNELKRKNQIQMARKFLDRYGWENHQMDLIKLYNEL